MRPFVFPLMKFRFKAFALHLLASASVLTFVLGSLYLGWYRWPGWYVAGVASVVAVLVGVDLALGPLMTFVVAKATKPRSELKRDIAIIAGVQLCALIYGTTSLWQGRPLYYAFSVDTLQLVQAYDLNAQEIALARQQHAAFQPHWYSLPQWIWAPLPQDPRERNKILGAVLTGGDDVTAMPRYFKPWTQGLPELRGQLKRVDSVLYFSKPEKQALAQSMRARGLDSNQNNTISLSGRGKPLLAVFDPKTLNIVALLAAPALPPYRPHQQKLVARSAASSH